MEPDPNEREPGRRTERPDSATWDEHEDAEVELIGDCEPFDEVDLIDESWAPGQPAPLPDALRRSANRTTSVDRAALLATILTELESCYLSMQNGQFSPIYTEWASSLETLGKQVSVDYGSEKITGQALRVERDGSLIIKTPNGTERSVLAGDIT